LQVFARDEACPRTDRRLEYEKRARFPHGLRLGKCNGGIALGNEQVKTKCEFLMPIQETAPVPCVPGVNPSFAFCLHVSAEGRRHQLTCVDTAPVCDRTGHSRWSLRRASAGSRCGLVLNAAGTGCRWIWLEALQCQPPVCEATLRRLLSLYPMRPLLLTIADSVDLSPERVDELHRALLAGLATPEEVAAREKLAPMGSGPRLLAAGGDFAGTTAGVRL